MRYESQLTVYFPDISHVCLACCVKWIKDAQLLVLISHQTNPDGKRKQTLGARETDKRKQDVTEKTERINKIAV